MTSHITTPCCRSGNRGDGGAFRQLVRPSRSRSSGSRTRILASHAHGAIENEPDNRFVRQRAGIPRLPVALHLAPHPATVSCQPRRRTGRQGRGAHGGCWCRRVAAGDRGIGGKRAALIGSQLEAELDEVLGRCRYVRRATPSRKASEKMVGVAGHRHGHRSRSLLGRFWMRCKCLAGYS